MHLKLSVLDDRYWLIEQPLWGVIIETGIVEIVHNYSKSLLRDLQSNADLRKLVVGRDRTVAPDERGVERAERKEGDGGRQHGERDAASAAGGCRRGDGGFHGEVQGWR